MARQSPSAIISGAGWTASVFLKLQKAVQKEGGTDEDLYKIDLPGGESLITGMAKLIVGAGNKVAQVAVDLQVRLKALIAGTGCGKNFYLDSTVKDSDLPDEVEGEDAQFEETTTRSRHTAEIFGEIKEKGRPMASPQVLLERYAKAHPEAGKHYQVAVIWQKNGRWFYAALHWHIGRQRVDVYCSGAYGLWSESSRFLVRKP